jgi:hypothetical protein
VRDKSLQIFIVKPSYTRGHLLTFSDTVGLPPDGMKIVRYALLSVRLNDPPHPFPLCSIQTLRRLPEHSVLSPVIPGQILDLANFFVFVALVAFRHFGGL